MSRPASSVRIKIATRLIDVRAAAKWAGRTLDQFLIDLPALRHQGFPAPCPITGNFDLNAMEAWQDRRSGLASHGKNVDAAATMRARLKALNG